MKETRINKQNLYIVITLVTKMYRAELPDYNEIFKNMIQITKSYSHCKILNYYDNENFSLNDFYNGDHLNKRGATKLTQMINNEIF